MKTWLCTTNTVHKHAEMMPTRSVEALVAGEQRHGEAKDQEQVQDQDREAEEGLRMEHLSTTARREVP